MAIFIPKDRKSLFRQFLAGMYDAVVITDPNGYVLEVNPRAVEYFGYDADEALDKPFSLFIPKLTQDVIGRIRHGFARGLHVIVDANGVTKDGRKIACEVSVSPIDLMHPGDLIFTIRNNERRRAYMSAVRSRSNAALVSQAAIFTCDEKGRVVDCNEAFARLFGLKDAGEARQRSLTDFLGESAEERFRKALSGETVRFAEAGRDVVLAPDVGRHGPQGVVGSVVKV